MIKPIAPIADRNKYALTKKLSANKIRNRKESEEDDAITKLLNTPSLRKQFEKQLREMGVLSMSDDEFEKMEEEIMLQQ